MKRASVAGALLLSAAVAACGGREAGEQQAANDAGVRPTTTTATGCLTANGGKYVLTDLERASDQSASAQPATETYQLVGSEDQLKPHVGQQVRVNGEAEASRVAEVRESTPASTPGAAGTSGEQPAQPQQPTVTTETETRMEVATLRVQSVTPTGSSCAAETMGGAAPQRPRQ